MLKKKAQVYISQLHMDFCTEMANEKGVSISAYIYSLIKKDRKKKNRKEVRDEGKNRAEV